ncbi:sensor histidine kinase [Gracilibacillus sp. YIM 98692]|uniref:cache domain-containing sensor histidine kinase n=1 Tax=Gracilibacillus sp. YIM 98692 TaxID=2663532 RepID=UPI0013D788E9|nr:sensor histidine kinase [Gracilibacillus sp. YIM 98692]
MITFQKKMLLGFLLFIVLPVILTGYVSYKYFSDTLSRNISAQTIQTLSSLNLNLKESVEKVNMFSDYVVSSPDIQSFLKTNNYSSIYQFYNQQQSIASMMQGNSEVDDFVIYSEYGHHIQLKNNPIPELDQFKNSTYYEKLVQAKGKPVWLAPSESQWFIHDEPLLIHSRVIKDMNTLNDLGYLVLSVNMALFDDIFTQIAGESSQEMIINENGTILYSLNHDLIGETLQIENRSDIQSGNQGYVVTDWNGQNSLITYMPTDFQTGRSNELMLVSVQDWDVLAEDIHYIRNLSIFLILFAVAIAGAFHLLYLRHVYRFVGSLLQSMKQVEHGVLDYKLKTFHIKELDVITHSFNKMLDTFKRLLKNIKEEQEYKRKAEFQVLQQQMNPHFLYNTLESINALASLNGQREISKMTIHLGKLLRISINGSFEVTVEEEIRHMKSYLEIQKVRYDNRFSYQVKLDDSLKNAFILKLVLQPLVENILLHGLHDEQKTMITIQGEQKNGMGILWIEDNGTGIEPSKLHRLNKNMEERLSPKNGGHGIQNVHHRLRMLYGDHYGLIICSEQHKGTLIKLTFPIKGD